MKRILLFLSLTTLFGSCDENEGPVYLDTGFNLELLGSESKDLLDPNVDGAYEWDKIRIYPNIEDMDNPFYKPNLDDMYGFYIFKETNTGFYQMAINAEIENNVPFLLKFREDDIDTIKCQVVRYGENLRTEKIWYNGELKWDFDSKTPKVISIVKD